MVLILVDNGVAMEWMSVEKMNRTDSEAKCGITVM